MIDVVIPARNEARTIGDVMDTFLWHPDIGRVLVVVDPDTTDNTEEVAMRVMSFSSRRHGSMVLRGHEPGKGQCAKVGLSQVRTERVIFCDADITGLTPTHVTLLSAITGHRQQTVLVPNTNDQLPVHAVASWQWVSGERSLPTVVARSVPLHGYLMEEQLNRACKAAGITTSFAYAMDLYSRFNMTPKRLEEMERDRQWGIENGVFDDDNYQSTWGASA